MLVLTRKSRQSIMIGDDIEVSVLSIMGEKVRLGIQAPRDIPVFRNEVYLEIQQQNVAARPAAAAEVDEALKRLSAEPMIGPAARRSRLAGGFSAAGEDRAAGSLTLFVARQRPGERFASRGWEPTVTSSGCSAAGMVSSVSRR